MKTKNTKESGITLIALIITIIVLLILAGVSIAMVVGDNGILSQSANASIVTDIVETYEQIQLALVGKYDGEGKYTKQDVIDSAYEITGNEVDMDTQTVLSKKGNEVDLSDLFAGAYVEPDTTAPIFEVGTDISSNNLTVTVTAEDEGGIQSYTYYLDGTSEKEDVTDETTSTYTFYGLSEGSHTVKIVVKDTSDNEAEQEVSVVIDTTGPSVAITPTTSCDSSWSSANIKLAVSASDDNGIASYEYYLDNSSEKTNTTTKTSDSYTYTGLDLGTTYTVKVIVKDTLGNATEEEVDVDTTGLIIFYIDGTSYQAVEGMTWNDWMYYSNEGRNLAAYYGYQPDIGLVYVNAGSDSLDPVGLYSEGHVAGLLGLVEIVDWESYQEWYDVIGEYQAYTVSDMVYYEGVDLSWYDEMSDTWYYGCEVFWYSCLIYVDEDL